MTKEDKINFKKKEEYLWMVTPLNVLYKVMLYLYENQKNNEQLQRDLRKLNISFDVVDPWGGVSFENETQEARNAVVEAMRRQREILIGMNDKEWYEVKLNLMLTSNSMGRMLKIAVRTNKLLLEAEKE